MSLTKEKLKKQIEALLEEGNILPTYKIIQSIESERAKKEKIKPKDSKYEMPLERKYQIWYSKTLPVIKQILPERYDEFVEQYKISNRKELTGLNCAIYDYLNGIRPFTWDKSDSDFNFIERCDRQLAILESCLERIDSVLSDIIGTLQADMFDDELEAAEELLKKKHFRASGTLAGVTLERHLGTVAQNHNIKLSKKEPTISDFNDSLKMTEFMTCQHGALFKGLVT